MYYAAFCASLALFAGSGNKLPWLERPADCNNVYEDIVQLIFSYLLKHEFFRHFIVKKQGSPCLLRGSLAYIFSGLLIWMQYVKSVCGKSTFLVYRKKLNGLETFYRLKTILQLPLVMLKCCCLTGKESI